MTWPNLSPIASMDSCLTVGPWVAGWHRTTNGWKWQPVARSWRTSLVHNIYMGHDWREIHTWYMHTVLSSAAWCWVGERLDLFCPQVNDSLFAKEGETPAARYIHPSKSVDNASLPLHCFISSCRDFFLKPFRKQSIPRVLCCTNATDGWTKKVKRPRHRDWGNK